MTRFKFRMYGDLGDRSRRRRAVGAVVAMATLVLSGVASAGPASAASLSCGSSITANTTLSADVGPCTGDGLVVPAGNITLDLNGYRVFGANGDGDNAGIRLMGASGVTVRNGTVQGFDAGVAIMGGSGNTLSSLTIRDNINDGLGGACDLGDGIAIFNSNSNEILGNRIVHNGPFGGVSLVENSDGNLIRSNRITDHNVVGVRCGNSRQDEGIRFEGPGANNNRAEANRVERSLLAGISLHGNVGCRNQPPDPDNDGPPNTDNFIVGNNVSATAGAPGGSDGIAALAQGPFGKVVCAAFRNTISGNRSYGNEGNGIFIPGTSTDNVINSNTVYSNGVDGIYLGGPIYENVFTNVGPTLFDLVSPDQPPFVEGTDYGVLSGSGSGDVTAPLVPVGNIIIAPSGTVSFDSATSGCSPSDFAGFPVGAVALIQRGFCGRATKVANAVAAGASAVVMFNEGSAGRTGRLTAGVDPTTIPVLGTTYNLGVQLYNLTQAGPVTVHVITNTTNVNTQINVGAENNTLTANKGTGNAEHDAHDDNLNCDNNRWADNSFATINQACIGGKGVVTP